MTASAPDNIVFCDEFCSFPADYLIGDPNTRQSQYTYVFACVISAAHTSPVKLK